jgi:hypothetical protein
LTSSSPSTPTTPFLLHFSYFTFPSSHAAKGTFGCRFF